LQTTEGRMYTVKQLLASCWLNRGLCRLSKQLQRRND